MGLFSPMKHKKPAAEYNENIEDYTARIFHTHAILGLAALPFTPYNQYEIMKQSNFSANSIIHGVGWNLFFLILFIMGICARKFKKRFERHPKISRWCFDIMTTCLAGYLSWASIEKSEAPGDSQIKFIGGWWISMITLSLLNTISRWYLRTLAYAAIVLNITIKAYAELCQLRLILILVEIMIYFLLSNYLSEKDSKKKFMEKQKLYEETQVFKDILDQTTDGILIYGLQEDLIYRNWENNKYKWWKEGQALDENLKQIKIDQKKSSGNLITQPIALDTQADSETNETDLWESLKKMAQNLNGRLITDSFGGQQVNIVECLVGKFEYIQEAAENGRLSKESTCEGALAIRIMPLYFREKPALALIFHDITERSKISILEDNDNYKNRLLASVSHELRTPLNASINFIQAAIDDPKLSENIRDNFLLPSLSSNRLLLFLINDILDFSQMAANKLRLVYEKSDVKKTVEECLNLIRLQVKRKGLSLDVEYQIETPTSEINTDHNRLKQIILNLLSNALKFTLEGGIKLRVKLLNSLKYNKILHVEVEDTGIGISEEDQEMLFKAFEKIDLGARISLNSSGVGLGLVISNNLVQMLGPSEQGHSIKVTSHPNQGSVFSFCLIDKEHLNSPAEGLNQSGNYTPRMSETSEITHPSTCRVLRNFNPFRSLPDSNRGGPNELIAMLTTSRETKCHCPKVLIVDDDVFNITALNIILDKLGFASDSAYNGEQAIKKVLQRQETPCSSGCEQYRIIFMDCSMPILDGFEATKRLRAMMSTETIPTVPIIGCTAFVQAQERQRALASGMDTVCSKPIDRDKISSLIKEYISNGSSK